ncbi:hypothetical protein OG216_25850 [Streptomycetaceae bacterium NBC_01309]
MTAEDAVWADVVARYGGRCGCGGQCGASHRTTGQRCPRLHYGDGSADARLLVVPIDPHADTAGRSSTLLMAICQPCHAGWRRDLARADRAAALDDADQLDLFGDPPCTTPPCSDRDETEATMPTVTIPAPVSALDSIRLSDALTAAHNAGIHLHIAPNRFVMWDPARHRYVAVAGLTVPPDDTYTNA